METVERDFTPQGVKFFYIYKALAHPEHNGYVTPFTLAERLLHVAEAKRKLGSRIPWLCDGMENAFKHAMGNAPNSEFVVDPQGKLVVARRWSDPGELRRDLEKLIGPVANPTTVAKIGMKPLEPPQTAPTGIVPRLEVPGRMVPAQVSIAGAQAPDAKQPPAREPLYVKLRAEVDANYLLRGQGKVYLGFFLDPLYQVHWNNQVPPPAFEITAPAGVQVTPAKGKGPQVTAKADADPREFVVDVQGRSGEPLRLKLTYFACDDAETFCKPLTQEYQIVLARDPDGGSRRIPGGGLRPATRPPADGRPLPPALRDRIRQRVLVFGALDADGDGEVSADELARAADALRGLDKNRDGRLEPSELLGRPALPPRRVTP